MTRHRSMHVAAPMWGELVGRDTVVAGLHAQRRWWLATAANAPKRDGQTWALAQADVLGHAIAQLGGDPAHTLDPPDPGKGKGKTASQPKENQCC